LPLNAAELHARLRGMSPKALLAGILIAGFFITLPIWLASTPEERQQLSHTTTVSHAVEKNVGPLDLLPAEQAQLKEMLKPASLDAEGKPLTAAARRIATQIRPYVSDDATAETIARWVDVYSRRFRLPEALILGVIAVESQFDHFATSQVGARGLMQVMPFWKKKLGSERDDLFAIETNIRYGAAILRTYIDRYGKISRALAAYNGSLGHRRYPEKVLQQMQLFKPDTHEVQSATG